MSDVKVIPISKAYRKNWEQVFRKEEKRVPHATPRDIERKWAEKGKE